MNREKAIKIAWTHDIESFVDKIYDDFESRTCENCEYIDYRGLWPYCGASDSNVYDILEQDVHTFGCNKWETK